MFRINSAKFDLNCTIGLFFSYFFLEMTSWKSLFFVKKIDHTHFPRSWNKTEVHVTVCGEPLSSSSSSFNDSFSMSHHGKEGETQMGLLRNCKDDLDSEITQSLGEKHFYTFCLYSCLVFNFGPTSGNNFELLTCLESSGSTKLILLDNAFSTRIPSELDKEDVLLVRKRSPELPQLWEGIRRLARCK